MLSIVNPPKLIVHSYQKSYPPLKFHQNRYDFLSYTANLYTTSELNVDDSLFRGSDVSTRQLGPLLAHGINSDRTPFLPSPVTHIGSSGSSLTYT